MDKCREEFEIFWTARCCGLGVEYNLTKLINGDYYDVKAYYAWIGWSERQKSMKAVKFPNKYEVITGNECYHFNLAIDECKDAITQAGYEVEE